LIINGHQVVVVDNLSTGKSNNINRLAKFYEIDITTDKLFDVFNKEKPDVVSHHAAQMNVRKSTIDPLFDAKINILGTINVLEACTKYDIKHLVFASSGGVVYGEPKNLPAKENDPTLPISPYGIAKLACEHYIRYYSSTFNLKSTILRYGNVYGPRQNPEGEAGVVAIFIGLLLMGKTPIINGDGKQTRDFIYISDSVKAHTLVIDRGIEGIFNIGTGTEISVNEILNELINLLELSVPPKYEPSKIGEIERIVLDSSKFKKLTGWLSKVNLSQGLKETCKYFTSIRT